jgi:hypothetical protein
MKISKTLAPFIFGFAIVAMTLSGRLVAAPDEQAVNEGMKNRAAAIPSESRRLALETAGAFVNDGFRIRDGEWSGTLEKGAPLFLQVTLFAGESYWFVAASPMRGGVVRVTLYDSSGKRMKGEQWKDEIKEGDLKPFVRSAVGVAPEKSGTYFVAVELLESSNGSPSEFTLVYAYK